MLNPFLNFWVIFILCSCLIIVYFLIYIKYISNLEELIWKALYILSLSIILFIYFFFQDFIIWHYFFNLINEILIIKDTQDLVNISFDLSFIYAIYFLMPIIGIYILLYLINFNQKSVNKNIKVVFLCFCYYYILMKYLIDNDLFLANWDFFIKNQTNNYDFQPDLFYLVLTYIGDFTDLASYFFLFLFYLLNLHIYAKINNKKIKILSRLSMHSILSCFSIYFFGGEFAWFDCFLFCLTFIYLEVLYVTWLFFYKLKYKKYNIVQN